MGLDMSFYKGKRMTLEELQRMNEIRNHIYCLPNITDEYSKEDVELLKVAYNLFEREEDYYFRKHSDLHGYIGENLKLQSPNEDNGIYYMLDRDILLDILQIANLEIKGQKVAKEYQGFFWGKSCMYHWEETKEMIEEVLNTTKDDEVLYYIASY